MYQVTVLALQVADKVELLPEHIVAGLAATLVGAIGVEFTATATLPEGPLQPSALIHAT